MDTLDQLEQKIDEQQLQQHMKKHPSFAAIREEDCANLSFTATSPQQRDTASDRSKRAWNATPPTRNGMAPYLDIMTVSSSQYPTTLKNKEQQSLHTKLFVEPISVPVMKHTGLRSELTYQKESQPLYYPDGKKRKNIRKQIQDTLRSELYHEDLLPKTRKQRMERIEDGIMEEERDKARLGNGIAMLALEDAPRDNGDGSYSSESKRIHRGKSSSRNSFRNDIGRRQKTTMSAASSARSSQEGTRSQRLMARKSSRPGSRGTTMSSQSFEPISQWYQGYRRHRRERAREVSNLLSQLRNVASRADPKTNY